MQGRRTLLLISPLAVLVIIIAVCSTKTYALFIKSKHRVEHLNHFLGRSDKPYLLSIDELPKQLDYRNNNNSLNFASIDRNEFQPYYCGACWAFAATSALSDRLKILRQNAFPEINLSPQVILNCDLEDLGCHGGDFGTAYKFIYENGGIPDETCQIYEAKGHDTGKTCTAIDICRQCDYADSNNTNNNNAVCKARKKYKKWQISSHGFVNGTVAMMNEIYNNGPIACAVAEVPDLMHYKGGIIHDTTGRTSLDHAISIVGWGEENGIKYWIVRNQWGTWWGEQGYARVVRGINNIGIESDCAWAIPIPTPITEIYTATENNRDGNVNDESVTMDKPLTTMPTTTIPSSCRVPSENITLMMSVKKSIESKQDVYNNHVDLPSNYDWRNVDGIDYTTWIQTSQSCKSCWATSVVSMLSDRLNIFRKNSWPKIVLSTQVLLNCNGHKNNCENGGNPLDALEFIKNFQSLPDQTCSQYTMVDQACTMESICGTCNPTNKSYWPGQCNSVENGGPVFLPSNFTKYKLKEYGRIKSFSISKMKEEIFTNGPITCGIWKLPRNYESGEILSVDTSENVLTYEVNIVGWGVDEDKQKEYWIGRSSYGMDFGDYGYFKAEMNHTGIETECYYGVLE
jgi:cathepsin X